MFTAEHFIWLAICAAFIAVMTAVSVKKNFGLKLAGGIMVGFCIVSETGKVMSNMLESVKGGMHLDPLCLPFHLCSLMIFVVFYITFGKDGKPKQMCINFLSVMGTVGSFFALLSRPMEWISLIYCHISALYIMRHLCGLQSTLSQQRRQSSDSKAGQQIFPCLPRSRF